MAHCGEFACKLQERDFSPTGSVGQAGHAVLEQAGYLAAPSA